MKTFSFFLTLFLAFTIVTASKREFQGLSKRAPGSGNGEATYFESFHLKNSACYGRNGLPRYDAKGTDLIGAMNMKGLDMCYKCLKVTNKSNGKTVTVKIIDKCVGCKLNKDVDLTRKAFSKIANTDLGRIKITWKVCSCPRNGPFPTFENRRRN